MEQKLLRIYALASILEADLVSLKAIRNFNNMHSVALLTGLERYCKEVRKDFDKGFKTYAEQMGDFSDIIDELIEAKIKEVICK